MTKIVTYDTTLRDGTQREGVSLSLEDKLRIAAQLDELGVDYIEGGFAGSNPKDAAFFLAFAEGALFLKHAQLVAFGLPVRKDTLPEDDATFKELATCAAPVIAIVGKASKRQVAEALLTTGDENLRMIHSSIQYLKAQGKRVFFDAEHYFDGSIEDTQYAFEVLACAIEAGAEYVVLADTNGGMLPHQIEAITKETVSALTATGAAIPLGIHAHNDSGCAVANTLEAVRAGATMVQGTVNGYGERVGNANLLTVIADLELKLGYSTIGSERLTLLTSISHFVADTMNVARDAYAPYVGAHAFTHKGGMHVSAELRMKDAYQHVAPETVGNFSHMVMSELSGRAALEYKARELGLNISLLSAEARADILDTIKQREAEGYSYESADGSLALLIEDKLGRKPEYFILESFRVITDRRPDGSKATEATIKIHVGDERFIATAEGNGPVSALDKALRAAITRFYPEIEKLELHDFKVRVLDGSRGTGSVTRVIIETSDGTDIWGTVGVSENIIEASWDALVDSISYGLFQGGAHEQ